MNLPLTLMGCNVVLIISNKTLTIICNKFCSWTIFVTRDWLLNSCTLIWTILFDSCSTSCNVEHSVNNLPISWYFWQNFCVKAILLNKNNVIVNIAVLLVRYEKQESRITNSPVLKINKLFIYHLTSCQQACQKYCIYILTLWFYQVGIQRCHSQLVNKFLNCRTITLYWSNL